VEKEFIWCLRIKTGIKITLPSEEEFNSYFSVAKEDLENLKRGRILKRWIPVVAYYCAYYSVYAFLRLMGIKSENHFCSILCFKYILKLIGENEKTIEVVENLKRKREEAQYYLKDVKINIKELENFMDYLETLKNKLLLRKESIRKEIEKLIRIANREET